MYRLENLKKPGIYFSGWMGKTPLWGDDQSYKDYLTMFSSEYDVAKLFELGYRVAPRVVDKKEMAGV